MTPCNSEYKQIGLIIDNDLREYDKIDPGEMQVRLTTVTIEHCYHTVNQSSYLTASCCNQLFNNTLENTFYDTQFNKFRKTLTNAHALNYNLTNTLDNTLNNTHDYTLDNYLHAANAREYLEPSIEELYDEVVSVMNEATSIEELYDKVGSINRVVKMRKTATRLSANPNYNVNEAYEVIETRENFSSPSVYTGNIASETYEEVFPARCLKCAPEIDHVCILIK